MSSSSDDLPVYAVDLTDRRLIVAARNVTQAAVLLKLERRQAVEHANITTACDEVEIARADAGSVWARSIEGADWQMVSSSRRALGFEPHGGARGGAGRPTISAGGQKLKVRSVTADDETWSRYHRLGGAAFLRNVINAKLHLSSEECCVLRNAGGGKWLRKLLKLPVQSSTSNSTAPNIPGEPRKNASTRTSGDKPVFGRPRITKEPQKRRSVSASDSDWQVFLGLGGSASFRNLLNSGFDLAGQSEWEVFIAAGGTSWLTRELNLESIKQFKK